MPTIDTHNIGSNFQDYNSNLCSIHLPTDKTPSGISAIHHIPIYEYVSSNRNIQFTGFCSYQTA